MTVFLAVLVLVVALSGMLGSSYPAAPVKRALTGTLGAETGKISVSGSYRFTAVHGGSYRTKLVCGTVGKSRRRSFAGVVHDTGVRGRLYRLSELVLEPPPGRPWLEREKELLDACAGPATR